MDPITRLDAAIADRDEVDRAADAARARLYAVIRDIAPDVKQVDIARRLGWSREHIRKIVKHHG